MPIKQFATDDLPFGLAESHKLFESLGGGIQRVVIDLEPGKLPKIYVQKLATSEQMKHVVDIVNVGLVNPEIVVDVTEKQGEK